MEYHGAASAGFGRFGRICRTLEAKRRGRPWRFLTALKQYLAFFKMAMKFLAVTLFFALVVIKPVHDANPEDQTDLGKHNNTGNATMGYQLIDPRSVRLDGWDGYMPGMAYDMSTDYLWMYLVFAYLFTALTMYLIITDTAKIIAIRQEYLGSQCTVTDRTIKLSGIPSDMRSEQKIKEAIEALDIGKVDSVTLCRQWKELDDCMAERLTILRRLEEAWTVYLGSRHPETSNAISSSAPTEDEDGENGRLLQGDGHQRSPKSSNRPQTRIWYGFLKFQSKKIDAIDYYEEKLHRLDENITALRRKNFLPTPIAFVTMDSVATAVRSTSLAVVETY